MSRLDHFHALLLIGAVVYFVLKGVTKLNRKRRPEWWDSQRCHQLRKGELPAGLSFKSVSFAVIGNMQWESGLDVAFGENALFFRSDDDKERIYWIGYSEIAAHRFNNLLRECAYFRIAKTGGRLDLGTQYEPELAARLAR